MAIKISLFFSIATTFSISAGIWAALTLEPRMGEIFLLLRPTAAIYLSSTGVGAALALVPLMGEVSSGLVERTP